MKSGTTRRGIHPANQLAASLVSMLKMTLPTVGGKKKEKKWSSRLGCYKSSDPNRDPVAVVSDPLGRSLNTAPHKKWHVWACWPSPFYSSPANAVRKVTTLFHLTIVSVNNDSIFNPSSRFCQFRCRFVWRRTRISIFLLDLHHQWCSRTLAFWLFFWHPW